MKSIFNQNSNSCRAFSNTRQSFIRYWRDVTDAVYKNIFLVIVVSLANTLLLLLGKMMWSVYILTPVGRKFIAINPETAGNILELFDRNLAMFSFKLTCIVFVICFVVSAVCRVLHVLQYFYSYKGVWSKIFFWGLPLTFITAVFIKPFLNIGQLNVIYIAVLFPTLCVFTGCFDLSIKLFPELGILIDFIKRIIFGSIETNCFTPFFLKKKYLSLIVIAAITVIMWNTGVFDNNINNKPFHDRDDYHEYNDKNLPIMHVGLEAARTVFEKCESFIISTKLIEDSNQDDMENKLYPMDI